jgi:hypothetical protein
VSSRAAAGVAPKWALLMCTIYRLSEGSQKSKNND